jgi:hypothetical protein
MRSLIENMNLKIVCEQSQFHTRDATIDAPLHQVDPQLRTVREILDLRINIGPELGQL